MLRLNKTKILLFIVSYMLFVTLTTIYYNIVFFTEYFTVYNFGFVLTKTGVSIITPLLPLSRLILGFLGLTGSLFLLAGRKKGLWISACWAILQIPSITITFGEATKNVLMGLASLNIQRFFAGTFHLSSQLYESAFTKTTSVLTKGLGVNFVGVIILFILMIIWIQNNEKALTYLKISSSQLVKKIFIFLQSAMVIMLVGVVTQISIQNYITKPKLAIEVTQIACPVDINFVGNNGKIETVLVDLDVVLRNKGKSPTTVESMYLEMKMFPLTWMPDTPIYGTYYPGGSNKGIVSGLMQKKLWNLIPPDLKKNEFNSFRINAEDKISKHFSFIIPIREIINEDNEFISLNGVFVVETVGGDTFQSEVFEKGNFIFNRRLYPKKEILVKDWLGLFLDNSYQFLNKREVQQNAAH